MATHFCKAINEYFVFLSLFVSPCLSVLVSFLLLFYEFQTEFESISNENTWMNNIFVFRFEFLNKFSVESIYRFVSELINNLKINERKYFFFFLRELGDRKEMALWICLLFASICLLLLFFALNLIAFDPFIPLSEMHRHDSERQWMAKKWKIYLIFELF